MSYTKEDLEKILEECFRGNDKAFQDGRKNDDAVDMSIICHCLGYCVYDIIDVMADSHGWTKRRYDETMEHINRVQPYLNSWGEPGTMDAMVYCINY